MLGRARHDVSWVNIWQDAEAAAFVARYHDGNEVVPTAITGQGDMIPAMAHAIAEQLQPSRR